MKTAGMKERNVKVDILMCIVAVLLCATLFSMHLAGGLYARYTTSTSGGDSARVAEFKIKQDGTIFKTVAANVTPGTTQSADLIITNKSEVSVEYTVKVTNVTRNLPLEFTLTPKAEAAASEGQNTPSEDQAASPLSLIHILKHMRRCRIEFVRHERRHRFEDRHFTLIFLEFPSGFQTYDTAADNDRALVFLKEAFHLRDISQCTDRRNVRILMTFKRRNEEMGTESVDALVVFVYFSILDVYKRQALYTTAHGVLSSYPPDVKSSSCSRSPIDALRKIAIEAP